MDLAQEEIARNLGEGHRVIHGVAGSGTTQPPHNARTLRLTRGSLPGLSP